MNPVSSTDHWIDRPHGRIFARQWHPSGASSAAPIVMLHDSLGSVDLWRGFPEAICALTSRRVIAYDRLGFGRSDPRTGMPPADFVAEEAALYFPALRERLGLERFVAMGHSVGGGMAIEIAAQMPEACEALVTIAAQVFAEDRTLKGIRAAREQFKDPAQLERLAKYHGDKARWVLDAWTESWLSPAFAAWTLEPVLPRVTCPVLAIHGEVDEYGSTVHPLMIERLCGGPVTLRLLPGIGHVPHREKPALVDELLSAFFAPQRTTQGPAGAA